MIRRLTRLVSLACLAAGCGGSQPAGPSPPGQLQPPATFASEHFTFVYTPLDAANISAVAGALERDHARIAADLGATAMPRVTVHFHAGHASLARAVAPAVGAIPSWASGLATAATEIHLISPNHPEYGPVARMTTNLVHEFAHCVSLHVNPRIGNNPRWFWEAVALNEAGQLVNPRTLPYMTGSNPPALASLNTLADTPNLRGRLCAGGVHRGALGPRCTQKPDRQPRGHRDDARPRPSSLRARVALVRAGALPVLTSRT